MRGREGETTREGCRENERESERERERERDREREGEPAQVSDCQSATRCASFKSCEGLQRGPVTSSSFKQLFCTCVWGLHS